MQADLWFNFHSCFTSVRSYIRTAGIKCMREYLIDFLKAILRIIGWALPYNLLCGSVVADILNLKIHMNILTAK